MSHVFFKHSMKLTKRSSTWPYGRSKAKRGKGSYSTRAELEVELNATTGKNEVLIDCLAVIEAKNEKVQNCMESVGSGMMKIEDLFFRQFNTLPPSIARDGHVTRSSNLISIFILFIENWFGLNIGRYLGSMKLTVDAKLLVYIVLVYKLAGTSST
ncbi:hypothetical protein Cgig2_004329 [Carnegiea gigantea]|uniref:Uncharacterized protein n=1 Tax=Carnegiea gigantea TaxID=171969 RepID=A0A9Q1Q8U5_9CARY|nr:hypothetical protein Cgig2_004329 [Carnegiea gigantea]